MGEKIILGNRDENCSTPIIWTLNGTLTFKSISRDNTLKVLLSKQNKPNNAQLWKGKKANHHTYYQLESSIEVELLKTLKDFKHFTRDSFKKEVCKYDFMREINIRIMPVPQESIQSRSSFFHRNDTGFKCQKL